MGRFEGNAFIEFEEWPGKSSDNYMIMLANFEDALEILNHFSIKIFGKILEEIRAHIKSENSEKPFYFHGSITNEGIRFYNSLFHYEMRNGQYKFIKS